jgi:sugar lactone lactonase YvrE
MTTLFDGVGCANGTCFSPDGTILYYLYTQRSYAEGYDPDDWLQAEAQIDDLIMNPEREDTTEVSAPLASP